MPYFECHIPGQQSSLHAITRKLTTLGSDEQSHVYIPAQDVAPCHATLTHEAGQCVLASTSRAHVLRVAGKKCRTRNLAHGEVVQLGQAHLVYSAFELAPRPAPQGKELRLHLDAQAGLIDLSEKMLQGASQTQLLEALIDHVIALCRADKGFLVLMQDADNYSVCVSRGLGAKALADPLSLLSDDIVREVLASQTAQIIPNARKDARFCKSRSVLDLDLSSVMCVPMAVCGEQLGLIYVGHDRDLARFEASQLKVLQIFASQAALMVKTADAMQLLRSDQKRLSKHIEQMRFGSLLGACPQMIEVFRRIAKVASTQFPVWLHGEPGTGKEVLARELHRRSPREQGPFVTFNSAVIPQDLQATALFGDSSSPGCMQRAQSGTLYLCEIDKLAQGEQLELAKLLANTPELDLRLVCSSTQDPKALLERGQLRQELYFRLSVVDAELVPLRDRGEDILTLAHYFLGRDGPQDFARPRLRFSKAAQLAMRHFSWPGNIRQLEHHVQKALILAEGPEISAKDLGLSALPGQAETGASAPKILPLCQAKDRWQSDYINRVLALNHGNRAQTARDLQVDPRTIFRHLQRQDKQRQDEAA